jgi:CysZ protein
MLTDAIRGARYILTGVRLLRHPGVTRFVIIPLLISAIVFSGGLWFGVHFLGGIIDRLDAMLPEWLDWLSWLLWPLFALLALVLLYFGFSLIANLFGAPFNSLLAEAVARNLDGNVTQQSFDWRQLHREALATMRSELGKMLYFVMWGIPCLLALLIPVIGPAIWFLYGAWAFACNYADYPMGNDGMRFAEQRRLLRSRFSLCIGFGAAALALTLVPVLNILAMPAAVAGMTALYIGELRHRAPAAQPQPSA